MASGVNAVLSSRQKEYIARRTNRAMRSLSHKVREFNPALSVSMQIDPFGQKVVVEVVEKGATKHGVRHVHALKGEYQLYWNFGKRFSLYIPDMQDPKAHEVHFHRRGSVAANQLFALLKEHLPKRDLSQKFRLVSFVDEGRVQLRDHEMKDNRKRAAKPETVRRRQTGKRPEVMHYLPPHVSFVKKRITKLETVMQDRLGYLFDSIELDTTFETDQKNVTAARLNLRMRPKSKHHARGTPNQIWIAGDLSMIWRGERGEHSRLDFTPTDGLPAKNESYASINLTRKSADITSQVFNLLVSSRLLINTSKKNKVPLRAPESSSETAHSRRVGREKYRRARHGRRQGNGGNFAALIKGGRTPGF